MNDDSRALELDEPLTTRRRFISDAEMDITPMIDMVFLLLIFFLVASKIDQATSVKLPPARRALAVAQETAIIVLVKKGADNAVVVARRDGSPFAADLTTQETEIAAYVEAGLTGSPPFERPMDSIIIKAEGNVREGEVARVAQAIGRVADTPVLNYAVVEQL
ncbi:MAG: biopolymer transporter ExbD [Pirellulaceae bacterium]|jgi:biopolymer transport protein ExbD|nr:biopolymer transporter ExbD [Pirellulaceae bacterium]